MSSCAVVAWCVLGQLLPVCAPVPADPPPDPLARGYLGITVAVGELAIERVEPRTPAAQAGLQPGDVLVRVGTLEPTSFEQVVLHICSFRPGAVVEVEVLRNGQRKAFKVKLASRPPELDRPGSVPGRPVPVGDE